MLRAAKLIQNGTSSGMSVNLVIIYAYLSRKYINQYRRCCVEMCLPVPILTVASFRGALAGTLLSHIQIIDSVGSLHQQSWPVMSWTNRDFLTNMFKITWLNIASCRRGDLELFPTSSRMSWTPSPFKLLNGNPFEYSDHTIPSISGTEAFETGIKTRDAEKCVV